MKIKDIVQTVILICCLIMLLVLGLAYTFYSQTTISPLEVLDKSFSVMIGVFGGTATLAAAYIASLLFNDWKEQHDKEIEIKFILRVLEYFEQFDLKITKMFQFDYSTIDLALRHDAFIRDCAALELDVRIIKVKYEDYHNYLGQSMPKSHRDIFLILQRSLNQLRDEDNIVEKRKLIKHRIIHDLLEFTEQYEKNIQSILIKNLKALK